MSEATSVKRVLVTGASGLIGRNCLPFLASEGWEVIAVKGLSSSGDTLPVQPGLRWKSADLLDSHTARRLIEATQPTHLLHLAWCVQPGSGLTDSMNLRWVEASLRLAEAFADIKGGRLVIAGTAAEYDPSCGPCRERDTPLAPDSLYAACKHGLNTILDQFAKQSRVSYAWGRIFYTFGPHENPNRLLPSVIRSLLAGVPAHCTHGKQVRDILYVKDLARALVMLLGSPVEGPVNLCSGQGLALKDLIQQVGAAMGPEELVQLGSVRPRRAEAPILVGDNTRLVEEVGWSPANTLAQGIAETVEWWKSGDGRGEK